MTHVEIELEAAIDGCDGCIFEGACDHSDTQCCEPEDRIWVIKGKAPIEVVNES